MLSFSNLRHTLCLCLSVVCLCAAQAQVSPHGSLRLVNTIALPGIDGVIDHLTFNQNRRHLLVSAKDHNTIEVIDANSDRLIQSITGLKQPGELTIARDISRFLVTARKDNSIALYDSNTFELVTTAPIKGIVGVTHYEPKSHQFWVEISGDSGLLGIFDAEDLHAVDSVRLDAPSNSFLFETGGQLLFANVPKAGHIAVIDRNRRVIVAKWPLTGISDFHSMALDEIGHRLFVMGRNPSKLVVLNAKTGSVVSTLELKNDAEEIFFDPTLHRILAIGGDGTITVIGQDSTDSYHVIETMPSAAGALGAFYFVSARQLYLAVPHSGDQQAEIRVYSLASAIGR